uniref:cdc42 effector protein 5-like n=1 Tax=Pristiophorus japonicus TaxID=55135 RepID=UPI00398F68F1
MPIPKPLAHNGTASKRRSRLDLTRDMISAPMGDFRHTMHVGRGGDAFGDTSFLSNRGPPRAAAGGAGGGGPPSSREQEEERGDEGEGGRAPGPTEAGEGPAPPSSPPPAVLRHAESVMSFHVDLGPSMLSEVLGVMEQGPPGGQPSPGGRREGAGQAAGEEAGCPEGEAELEEEEEEEQEEEEGGTYTFEDEEDDEIRV